MGTKEAPQLRRVTLQIRVSGAVRGEPWNPSLGRVARNARSFADLILGRPLAKEEEGAERVGVLTGVPVLGLDALASSAYGPEAALTVLIPLGAAAPTYLLPM